MSEQKIHKINNLKKELVRVTSMNKLDEKRYTHIEIIIYTIFNVKSKEKYIEVDKNGCTFTKIQGYNRKLKKKNRVVGDGWAGMKMVYSNSFHIVTVLFTVTGF